MKKIAMVAIATILCCGCAFAIRGVDEVELSLFKANKREVAKHVVDRQALVEQLYCGGIEDSRIETVLRADGLSPAEATKAVLVAKSNAKCSAEKVSKEEVK